jgi:hypothetical protein
MAALARRLVSIFMATLMVVGVMAPAASAGSHESEILAVMNSARADAGLAPVAMYADLTDDAVAWSQHMYSQGSLSHNPNLAAVTTGWDKLGENVGLGPTVSSIHTAFMASASHRGNVLGDYDSVGIAVVAETPTKLWVTVVFMKSLGQPVATEPTVDDPDPYAKQQPEPAPHQPEPAPQQAVTEAPSAPRPEPPPQPSVPFTRPAGRLFAI